jgi:hypothetical protein
MMLKGDIDQPRAKNSSSGDPNFSVLARAIFLIFFLFERACQNAQNAEALFFKFLFFYVKKNIIS